MGRRKVAAAASQTPPRGSSKAGGGVISEIREKHKLELENLTLTKHPFRTLRSGLHTFVLYLGPHIALFTIKAVQCGRIDLKTAPYDTIQLKQGPSWLDKKCSDFGPPVYQASAHSVRIPVFELLPQVQLEAVLWGIGTALGELPPYFISRAARLSGSEPEAVKELDAAASDVHGPIASTLNRTKRWLLSHSQHLNFITILILASVPNPLFDLAGIMCGQFCIPFWEFFFATLIGKAIIKTHIQTLLIISLCNNQLLYLMEKELIWIFGHIPGFSASLPSVIAKLHSAKDKYLSTPTSATSSSKMEDTQWNFSFTLVWNTVVWLVLVNFFIKIVTSTAQEYLKKQQDIEMELITDSSPQTASCKYSPHETILLAKALADDIKYRLDEIRGAKDPTCLASNLTPENHWRIAQRAEAVEAESGERADMAAAESNVEFIRARSDKREYRRVVLPNALECLLISDSETDKAAACMEVGVGSFSDPEGLEGLAHFLEHMLFYASEKYPGEQDYTKYITEHGGSCNAYTSSETTNFYFDVNVANFEEALDRFAQFFIKPLMSQEAVLREIKAVDSGSWETLETKPKERGLDIRQELLKFYENYSANLMHLVVYGKESLDCIQSFVERLFSDIKNTDQRSFKCPSQPLSEQHMQLVIKAIPISEGDYLKISWPVTPNIHFYKEGWAMNLSAGEGSDSAQYSFFSISMRLTDAGHEHMEDIIGLVFKYILLLKENGIHEWIFDELVAINETEFHYQDKVHPISYVTDTVSTMRLFPPEEWLGGASLPSKYAPNRINMILDELSAERVRILWESKKFKGSTDSVEPWYSTAYSVENVTPSMIQQWIQKAPTEKLCIPKPNIFIPKDLSLKEAHEKVKFPAILRKTPLSRLWYKPDMLFSTPKVHIIIDFHCPLTSHSPEAVISTSLFVDLLADYLNAYGGYNDKMRILLDAIMKHISNFEVKPNRFCALKETAVKDYQNFKFSQPYSQASYYLSLILEDQKWPLAEKLEALSKLEPDSLAKFMPHLLSKTFLECYIHGNIEPNEATSIVQEIEDTIFNTPNSVFKSMSPSQYLIKRVIMLENELKCYHQIEGLNQKNENSSVVQYIQVHLDDALSNIKLQLFALIASQPAFNQLRTVEQLGYIAGLSLRSDCGVWALEVVIQSTVKDPSHLDARIDEFFKMFESKIHELSDKDFKRNVKSLVDSKLEKFKNLWEESHFYWGEIEAGTLKFDRVESEVALLRELKKEEFIEFFDQHIRVGAPQRKTVSVQVFGGEHLAEFKKAIAEADTPKTYRITDIFGFKRSRPLYRSLKGGPGRITMD
uniref:Peptidase M16 N-terminal domain-containing protein n=1 Tax=Oryza meridionalis TaxID=40149 RepID=A0A0E0C8H8_9ORYZ